LNPPLALIGFAQAGWHGLVCTIESASKNCEYGFMWTLMNPMISDVANRAAIGWEHKKEP
jgi:hypothetical protein